MEGLPDYLYVHTFEHLLRLDLKNYCNYNPNEAMITGESPEKPDILVNFSDFGFPKGMGVIKLGSRIFLVGGEQCKKVIEYNPCKHSFELSGQSFNGLKRILLVEEIAGKIYVLHHPSGILDSSSLNPSWVSVCPPEFYSFFTFRNRIYVKTSSGKVIFFDEIANSWNEDAKLQSLPSSLLPHFGKMLDDDIVLATKAVDCNYSPSRHFLYAYLYSKDGSLVACQDLGDIFDGILGYNCHFFVMDRSSSSSSSNRICAIALGSHPCTKCTTGGEHHPLHTCYSKAPLEKVLVVSIVCLTRLPIADQLQSNEASAPAAPSVPAKEATPVVHGIYNANFIFDPQFPNLNQELFLSSSIEKHYFNFEDFSQAFLGAFFA